MNNQLTSSKTILKKARLRKGKRGVQKGIIHVQASFNNTTITVTDVRG
jgi:small subunit ribosomal protein S11